MDLDTAVNQLTRNHPEMVDTGDGQSRIVMVPPLLAQLHAAVTSSTARGVQGSTGTPLPLSADALDLMQTINTTATEHWWLTHNRHYGQGRETTVGRLRNWAAAAHANPDDLRQATRITNGWINQIRALFNPRRTWEVKGACPSCGVARVLDETSEEGSTINKHALSIVYDGQGKLEGAECAACGETWPVALVIWLARTIAHQTEETIEP